MDLIDHAADGFLRLTNHKKKRRFLAQPEIAKAFNAQKDEIEAIRAETGYWHGLGRLRYPYKGDSKWNGVDHTEAPIDILPPLLKEGLLPQHDFFHGLNNLEGQTDTVSTTPNRQYARAYASMYGETAEGCLEYTYGSRAFWAIYFLADSLLKGWKDIDFLKKEFRIKVLSAQNDPERQHRRKSVEHMLENAEQWGAPSHKPKPPISSNSGLLLATATSDIPNNHPLIVGIRSNAFQAVPMWRPFIAHEVRSSTVISPDQWTCLEVPLQQVESVRAKIREQGLEVPIVPIEFAELMDSEIHFRELGKARQPTEQERILNHKPKLTLGIKS